jgi:predicted amino acid-binding ACT domain protein
MISVILSVISSLLSLAGKIFDFLYAKQLVDAGKAAQQVADLKAQVDAAHEALQARIAVEHDAVANPDGVPDDDDGFRRND